MALASAFITRSTVMLRGLVERSGWQLVIMIPLRGYAVIDEYAGSEDTLNQTYSQSRRPESESSIATGGERH